MSNICPICGNEIDIIVHCGKFVNNRSYDGVCFICFSCVKQCGPINEDEWELYSNDDVVHLYSAEDMARHGWSGSEDQARVKDSLKKLKAAIKKAGKKIA